MKALLFLQVLSTAYSLQSYRFLSLDCRDAIDWTSIEICKFSDNQAFFQINFLRKQEDLTVNSFFFIIKIY